MADAVAGNAEIAETHSAWVVLLGDRAYKIKKPVQLGFLDFSTREVREAVVHRELELNRRLAPDVYLGVSDVLGPDGEVCEHLLVMRRMPDERRLATLVEARAPLDAEIRDIARVIATFHARAETSTEISGAGRPAEVQAKVERDFEQMRAYVPDVLDGPLLDEVGRLVERFIAGRVRLYDRRVADGHVRDGHGDLLAADIFCLPDGPRILDCIEFDDRLRYVDVLSDVAFLAMDLERLGAPELSAALLTWYQEFSGESYPDSLAEHYIACRALIRSKVACIRVSQGDDEARGEATALLELAYDHLRRSRVRLVLVGGPPGSGKSTLASGLAETLGWTALRSDEVRKDVAGLGHLTPASADFGSGIYDRATTEATYTEMLERAGIALALGETVVLDASWSSARWREAAARLARETSSDLVEFRCDAPAGLADARVDARDAGSDPSDATIAVAARMRATFDEWPSAHIIDTGIAPRVSLDEALDLIGAVDTS